MKDQLPSDLHKFLVKHFLYRRYIHNFKNCPDTTVERTFSSLCEYLLKFEETKDYFYTAFTWSNTKEGYKFWHSITEKWEQSFIK